MPKIIAHLPERLVEEARRQVSESGYGALTIRSVAKGCGVGVGTVYNYFPSKDALVATFMLDDWKVCIADIQARAESAEDAEPVLRAMYDNLTRYLALHRDIFRDEAAAVSFTGSFSRYHGLLRSQLSAPIRRFCRDDFTADFVAEAMLTWTVSDVPYDALRDLLQRIF